MGGHQIYSTASQPSTESPSQSQTPVVSTFSLFIWVFSKAITTQLFFILRKCLYCEHNTSTVANKLSSVLILDLHAVKDKRTVKYVPLKEGKWRSKLLLHCYRLRDFYFLIYTLIFNPYKNMHSVKYEHLPATAPTFFRAEYEKINTCDLQLLSHSEETSLTSERSDKRSSSEHKF